MQWRKEIKKKNSNRTFVISNLNGFAKKVEKEVKDTSLDDNNLEKNQVRTYSTENVLVQISARVIIAKQTIESEIPNPKHIKKHMGLLVVKAIFDGFPRALPAVLRSIHVKKQTKVVKKEIRF